MLPAVSRRRRFRTARPPRGASPPFSGGIHSHVPLFVSYPGRNRRLAPGRQAAAHRPPGRRIPREPLGAQHHRRLRLQRRGRQRRLPARDRPGLRQQPDLAAQRLRHADRFDHHRHQRPLRLHRRTRRSTPTPAAKEKDVTFGPASTDSSETQQVTQFDPSLGTLKSVEIDMTGNVSSVLKLINLDPKSQTPQATINGDRDLAGARRQRPGRHRPGRRQRHDPEPRRHLHLLAHQRPRLRDGHPHRPDRPRRLHRHGGQPRHGVLLREGGQAPTAT